MISSSHRPVPDNTQHSQETSMALAEFKSTISAGERPQIPALRTVNIWTNHNVTLFIHFIAPLKCKMCSFRHYFGRRLYVETLNFLCAFRWTVGVLNTFWTITTDSGGHTEQHLQQNSEISCKIQCLYFCLNQSYLQYNAGHPTVTALYTIMAQYCSWKVDLTKYSYASLNDGDTSWEMASSGDFVVVRSCS